MIIITGIIVLLVLWFTVLKPYQQDRITAFLFPTHDPLGANYNVIQSKIAIGSAGFWGKGFGGGTQVKLNFLPAAKTDFLFAAFIEEWGIIGGLILISVFLFFVYRLVGIGRLARDNYSRFIVLGTISFIFIHFIVNIGANIGLLPVTGLTLPLFSYGGSNLLTTSLLLSIIEHVKLGAI
jgi:rod shape determining protein RodA